MSLIQFHIFLISISILFSIGFGFWELTRFATSMNMLDCWTGFASFSAAAFLVLYLLWFLRRLRKRKQ